MAREAFRKHSTTVLKRAPSGFGDWAGLLEAHKNLVNHQIMVTCGKTMIAGKFSVHVIPDHRDPRRSVDIGKTIDLAGKNSGVVTFTGVLAGLRLESTITPDPDTTVSVVVSSYSRLRHRWLHQDGRASDYDYISTTLFEDMGSGFGNLSRLAANNRNMVYHQLSIYASGPLNGEYRLRFVPDEEDQLEATVDSGKTINFNGRNSAFVQFGGVIRGIHLEPITQNAPGETVTAVLSSSVERFDEITFEFIGSDPVTVSHINDFNNPHQTSWDNLLNKPATFPPDPHNHFWYEIQHRVANFSGEWELRKYAEDELVWDRPYTMQANAETWDRAAPHKIGFPYVALPSISFAHFRNDDPVEFRNDDPVEFGTEAFITSSNASVVWSGHDYTTLEDILISQLRVWVPNIDPAYRYYFVVEIDPDGHPRQEQYQSNNLTPNAWNVINIPDLLVRAGTKVRVYIDALNRSSETTAGGEWVYQGPNGMGPQPQQWNQQAHLIVRIHETTGDSGYEVELGSLLPFEVELAALEDFEVEIDLAAALATFAVGDIIRFSESGDPSKYFEYVITAVPVDQGDHVEIEVYLIDCQGGGPSAGALTTLLATLPVAGATQYVESPNNWAGNQPDYLTVEGFLAFNGAVQGIDPDNLFGVDITVQKMAWSGDWDIVHMGA